MITRFAAARTFPRIVSFRMAGVRLYTDARREGSVAQSKGFSKKEKAHEDQYVHQHEQAQLAKLREQIENKKKELSSLEEQHEALAKK